MINTHCKEQLRVGDIVDHKMCGTGEILSINNDDGKIRLFWGSNRDMDVEIVRPKDCTLIRRGANYEH